MPESASEPLFPTTTVCPVRWTRRFGAFHEIEHECCHRAGHVTNFDYWHDRVHRCRCGEIYEDGGDA